MNYWLVSVFNWDTGIGQGHAKANLGRRLVRSEIPDQARTLSTTLFAESTPISRDFRANDFFKVGWDQLASSAGPPKRNVVNRWWAGEAPLVPPYFLPSFKKALALIVIFIPIPHKPSGELTQKRCDRLSSLLRYHCWISIPDNPDHTSLRRIYPQ